MVDADGRPVAGVLVLGVPSGETRAEWTERTASDGSFRLLGLPRGSCTLRAWTFDDDLRLASAPRTVEVPRETPVELRLPRGSSLRGVVRDAVDGVPI
ncbi:MAG: carboxypeptidase regulatory-like domain-containing protein, partial [Myxococcales bacterium]|nr:carboxypeptidase regulatory-like domain-containing protein [Myxococcales bacterium]